MQYQQVPQHDQVKKISSLKHKKLQQSFYVLIGLLFTCLVGSLILITLDILNIFPLGSILDIWIPNKSLSLVQRQQEAFYMESEQIESELTKLKNIFHEQLLEHSHVQIPIIDKSKYEYFTLENGLKVLVIEDESAQIAQAALCVNVGSWTEPDNYPGLAHFLEHMLFQGSITYPEEGYFQKLVAENGGGSNAYTRGEETNYYFKINNDRVLQALQVFAHFFIDPLLDSNMVEREVNAVNSEYEIAVSGDNWKIMHLIQILSNKPIGRFTIGSIETLQDPMEALLAFHEKYYSANIMSLVVRSNYKDMAKWIKESSDFNQIPNLNLKKNDKIPLPLKSTGQYVKYKVNSDKNTLLIIYELESPHPYKMTKPLELISQLIRSKHEGGLWDYLLKNKLGLGLDAGTFLEGNGDFTFFIIEVQLLEQVSVIQVCEAVVGYFNNMMDDFFTEVEGHELTHTDYLYDIWNQQKLLAASQFNYLDKNNQPPVQKLSHNLNYFDYQQAISVDYLYEDFNSEVIYNYLAQLIDPFNMVLMQGSPNFKELQNHSDLYRLDYTISQISLEQLQKIGKPITTKVVKYNPQGHPQQRMDLELPNVNNFIPTSFEMKSLCNEEEIMKAPLIFKSKEDCIQHEHEYEQINHYPQIIKRSVEAKVWWKLQRTFKVPQIFGGYIFHTPINTNSLKDKTYIQLFNKIMTENLNQDLQDAIDAGYQFQFSSSLKGISLEIYGWNQKYHDLVQRILESIQNMKVDTFSQAKQKLLLQYNNAYQDKIFRIAMTEYLYSAMFTQYFSPIQYIEELKAIDENAIKDFKSEYFSNFKLISFVSGNVLQKETEDIIHIFKKVFHKSKGHSQEESHNFNVRDLKGKSIVMALTHKGGDSSDINGVTLNYYQIGLRSKKSFAIMNLIQQFFHNHAFQYLRTERQLGYAVFMRFIPLGCVDGAAITVQGTAQVPYVVNKYIEEFIQQFNNVLINLSDEQLAIIKSGAKTNLIEKDQSLYEEGQYIWQHIKNNNIILEEREMVIGMLDDITKDEIIHFYQQSFIKNRGKLSLQIYGKGLDEIKNVKENLLENEEIIEMSHLAEYKCSYSLSNI